jgi:bacteriochlorophyll 4-vinyl reductase
MGWTHPHRAMGAAPRMGAPTLHGIADALGRVRSTEEAGRLLALSGVAAAWDEPPRDAVLEADFLSLLTFLLGALPRDACLNILETAGQAAGEWFVRTRIPAPARFLRHSTPSGMAFPLLLRTLEVHGWTIVGGNQMAPDPEHPRGLRLLHGAGARAFSEPRLLHIYYLGALQPIFAFFLGQDLRVETRDALHLRQGIVLAVHTGTGV